jgi:hypothetical protein
MQTTFFRKRVFVLAAVERPTPRFSTKSLDVPLVRIVSTFVLLSSAGVFALIILFAKLVQLICPCSRYFHKKAEQDIRDTTATIRQTLWIAGRRRARFRRWLSWLPVVTVFLNASLGDGSALSSTRFLGGVLDTGAAMSLVGYPQARALCNLTGVPYELSAGTRRFKFGDVVAEPYGMLTVPLRTPGGIVTFSVPVVPQNVPLLIGADMLDAQQWYIRNVTDELVSTSGWTLPLERWQGHYWLRQGFDEPPASTRFTRT